MHTKILLLVFQLYIFVEKDIMCIFSVNGADNVSSAEATNSLSTIVEQNSASTSSVDTEIVSESPTLADPDGESRVEVPTDTSQADPDISLYYQGQKLCVFSSKVAGLRKELIRILDNGTERDGIIRPIIKVDKHIFDVLVHIDGHDKENGKNAAIIVVEDNRPRDIRGWISALPDHTCGDIDNSCSTRWGNTFSFFSRKGKESCMACHSVREVCLRYDATSLAQHLANKMKAIHRDFQESKERSDDTDVTKDVLAELESKNDRYISNDIFLCSQIHSYVVSVRKKVLQNHFAYSADSSDVLSSADSSESVALVDSGSSCQVVETEPNEIERTTHESAHVVVPISNGSKSDDMGGTLTKLSKRFPSVPNACRQMRCAKRGAHNSSSSFQKRANGPFMKCFRRRTQQSLNKTDTIPRLSQCDIAFNGEKVCTVHAPMRAVNVVAYTFIKVYPYLALHTDAKGQIVPNKCIDTLLAASVLFQSGNPEVTIENQNLGDDTPTLLNITFALVPKAKDPADENTDKKSQPTKELAQSNTEDDPTKICYLDVASEFEAQQKDEESSHQKRLRIKEATNVLIKRLLLHLKDKFRGKVEVSPCIGSCNFGLHSRFMNQPPVHGLTWVKRSHIWRETSFIPRLAYAFNIRMNHPLSPLFFALSNQSVRIALFFFKAGVTNTYIVLSLDIFIGLQILKDIWNAFGVIVGKRAHVQLPAPEQRPN